MKRYVIIFGLLYCFSPGYTQIQQGARGLTRMSKQVSSTGKIGNVGRGEIGTMRAISTLPQHVVATAGKGGTTVPTQQIQQQVNSSFASSQEGLQHAQAALQLQGRAPQKTAQQWLEEYREHPERFAPGTPMYNTFKKISQKVKKGLKTDQASLEIAKIYQQNTTRRDPAGTAKKWLDEYRAHPEALKPGTTLYQTFYQISKAVQAGTRTDAASVEISRIYLENTTRATPSKTPEEWLAEYQVHPEELRNGTSMYGAFREITAQVQDGHKTDAASIEISKIYLENTTRREVAKSAEEWLAEYAAHPEELKSGTPMYTAFEQMARKVKIGEKIDAASLEMARIYLENTNRAVPTKTSEQWLTVYREHPEELTHGTSLYNAFRAITARVQDGHKTDAASIEISQIYLETIPRRDPAETAQKWLDKYREHPEEFKPTTSMYQIFGQITRQVQAGDRTDEAALEISRIYLENTKRIAAPKTTQEVYDLFLAYLRDYKTYPLATTQEYVYVYNRLRNRELSEIQADPDLYKLYRLDQLARAARRGEKPWEVFDRDNPLKRARINETSPQVTGTEIPLEESYAQLSTEEQTLIRRTEEYYEELWNNYPTWFEENKQYIITTTQTQRAFDILNREIQAGRWSEEISETLEVLQGANLGPDGFGSYIRIIYRGNSSFAPRAGDFHVVAEEPGLQVPPLRELFPQRIPHISFSFEGDKLSTMILEEGVTAQDVETAIDAFLEHYQTKQTGWTIRMGNHEMGNRPHIHFEFIDNAAEGGMDISHVLQLDVRQIIPADPLQARQRAFYRLFSKYINL